MNVSVTAERPLSARSVALSLLLGARPPRLDGRHLTALGELFDVSAATMRVALSRMVSAGDLEVSDGHYTLTARHIERQRITESLLHPQRRPYNGMWRMVVVVERGRASQQRAALRAEMAQARYAELREGVWLRPDNLHAPRGGDPAAAGAPEGAQSFTTLPDDDRALTRQLWDLPLWATRANHLLAALESPARPIEHLATAAATVRHLRTDPALPDELAPEHWPADRLRWAYEDYRTDLSTRYLGATTDVDASEPAEVKE